MKLGVVKKNTLGKKVGILGGGQLARMLSLKAHEMGLIPYVLSPLQADPAAQVTQHWVKGDPLDPSDLQRFLPLVHLATFESEFLDAGILEDLSRRSKISVIPKPSIMAQLQDRWHQKQILEKFNVPTAPFLLVENFKDAEKAFQTWGTVVFKKRRFGYDGYGTYVVRSAKELNQFYSFFESFKEVGFIAEKFIPFKRELAVSAARNSKEVVFLPLVETFQQDSRCLWVRGPVQHKKISGMQNKLRHMVETLGYQGIIAFELFDADGDLLVNEIAPRVHNSAHYSLNALMEDQFSLHWKALLNLPLNKPQMVKKGFAMWNLLGSGTAKPQVFPEEGVFLHWYGKSENRKSRKMGHINAIDETPNKAWQKVKKTVSKFEL